MNEFRGPKDVNFKLVADRLRGLVDRAPAACITEKVVSNICTYHSMLPIKLGSNITWNFWLPTRCPELTWTDQDAASVNVYWLVPRTVNDNFTGQTEVLAKIKDAIQNNYWATGAKQQQRFFITGIGGQGKSEVCLKIADMIRH